MSVRQAEMVIAPKLSGRAESRTTPGSLLAPGAFCGLLALVVCTLGTWRLDAYSMEGIIALGGEHMVRTGELFVPKLYGTVYAYKPALAYWLAGASLHALGRSEFALRLPTALCGAALCLVTFWTMARLVTPRCGLYAGLAMSTSILFFEQGRIAGYDMPLALGVSIGVMAATRNLVLRRPSPGWWIVAYLGLVLGFLSKGVPAFGMFGPGLLVAAVALRQVRQLFSWQHIAGLAVGALVLGAYLYLAYHQEGPAAFEDQYGEVSYRSGLWDARRVVESLVKPLKIWAAFLPGSLLLLPLLSYSLLALRARSARPRLPLRVRRLMLALGCFFMAGVAVWMILPVANTRYFLPLAAPVAGLAGLVAEALSMNPFRRGAGRSGDRLVANSPGTLRALWAYYKTGVVVTLAGLACWAAFAGYMQPIKAAAKSERSVAAAFARHLAPQETVFVHAFDGGSSLFYYLGHPVARWNKNDAPFREGSALIFNEDWEQRRPLDRTNLNLQVLERCQTGDKCRWLLARVSHRSG